MIDLSVIIVNWNTKGLLQNCLQSLFRYTSGISWEIFVVDNASSDGSQEMVEEQFPEVRLIRNRENVGYAKANNQALHIASGRYLLLLNSDTVFAENALEKMVMFMDTHRSAGMAGPRMLNPDGTWQYSCDLFPRTPLRMLRDKFVDTFFVGKRPLWRDRLNSWKTPKNLLVDYIIGAALIIRRETLEQIGWLDEQFFMYAEDIDWCYRAARAGWQTYYLGTISIYHHNRGSSQKSAEQAARLQKMRDASLLKFYRKHYGKLNAWLFRIILRLKSF